MTKPQELTCIEVFRRLDDFVDRQLSPAEMNLVRAHLETCVTCAREARFELRVIEAVRAKLRRIDIPPRSRERILASLRAPDDGPARGL